MYFACTCVRNMFGVAMVGMITKIWELYVILQVSYILQGFLGSVHGATL